MIGEEDRLFKLLEAAIPGYVRPVLPAEAAIGITDLTAPLSGIGALQTARVQYQRARAFFALASRSSWLRLEIADQRRRLRSETIFEPGSSSPLSDPTIEYPSILLEGWAINGYLGAEQFPDANLVAKAERLIEWQRALTRRIVTERTAEPFDDGAFFNINACAETIVFRSLLPAIIVGQRDAGEEFHRHYEVVSAWARWLTRDSPQGGRGRPARGRWEMDAARAFLLGDGGSFHECLARASGLLDSGSKRSVEQMCYPRYLCFYLMGVERFGILKGDAIKGVPTDLDPSSFWAAGAQKESLRPST